MDVAQKYASDPIRVVEAQASLWNSYLDIAERAALTFLGEKVENPPVNDKRFKAPEWQQMFVFNVLKQIYLLSTSWIESQVRSVEDVDPHVRSQAQFYVKQLVNALSPTNFLFTNPEVLRETMSSNGANLVKGMEQMLEDVKRGRGKLEIQQTDMSAFTIGENIATTPGKVVYQNNLMQMIQYVPMTEKVFARPLLIFPPWINKYYILDLGPQKSFIRWCLEQGLTVFVVSWVNPDARLAMKTFEDYMIEGVYAALDAVEKATGMKEVNAIGYCIGGTLLSATLAHMAATGDDRIKSATFFAAQADFTEAGELKVFIDEDQIAAVEHQMESTGGLLEGSAMASTFNMLRSNDLVWSYVVNNYLLGREPMAFDLLYWNADATRMPARMHAFYLRECYLKNNLAEGRMKLGGIRLDLHKVKVPVYLQSSREDHIAPYRSVYKSTKLFSGPIRFMMAGSGHIAGVINPPSAKKYQYWTNDELPEKVEDWVKGAVEHPGSWWGDWFTWIKPKSGGKVAARIPGDTGLDIIEDAPGSYVKIKSED
ncbi:MAG: class I poly(R)-hydroxyalkanoic acid synthase [Parvibaculaceae bacterium]|nr:class I poly(R)-hydroxyalkanoic acid synthase [Parvibaculaceae bacterium]